MELCGYLEALSAHERFVRTLAREGDPRARAHLDQVEAKVRNLLEGE
jgi:hypothetical protein